MLVDSHCHLNCMDLAEFNGNISAIIENAKQSEVDYLLNVCVNLQDANQVIKTAESCENVYATVGVQPSEQQDLDISLDSIIELADNPIVIGIGETGLDYYYDYVDRKLQQSRFRTQIRAALKLNKPLIIHSRAAGGDISRILKEENAANVGGVFHCFTEDWEAAKRALDLNFYLSFSGIITFKNADKLREVVKKVPLEKMLVETDAPYLSPAPYRGKQNQPAYVKYVAQYVAELKKTSFSQVADVTTSNFLQLFDIL